MPDDKPSTSTSTSNPLYVAPPPTSPSNDPPTVADIVDDHPPTPETQKQTGNPLFGASPDTSESSTNDTGSKERLEARSRERVESLKLARNNALSNAVSYQSSPPIPINPPSLPSRDPTTIPIFLKRLTYILSLILGLSSIVAGTFSIFLLPRLHSSFSARQAIVAQQSSRFSDLLEKLKTLKQSQLYAKLSPIEDVSTKYDDETSTSRIPIEEISSSVSSASSSHPISSTPALESLPKLLKSLATNLENTSTTRTSLLTSLSGYTSHLHSELFTARSRISTWKSKGGGFGEMSIGMGSLSENLSKEVGGSGTKSSGNEEWDAVRKEVRAIKGLLLNRRSFALTNGSAPDTNAYKVS